MVAIAYYVEHVFFALIFGVIAALWFINLWREQKNPAVPEQVRALNRIAIIVIIIYAAHIYDWRGVYGILTPPVLYLFQTLIEITLFGVFCFFLYAMIKAIYMNENFNLSSLTENIQGSVDSIRVFLIAITVTLALGGITKTALLFAFNGSQKVQLSIIEGSWMYWLTLHFLVLLIWFMVVTIRLRSALMAQLSPNSSVFDDPGFNELDAMLWAAICKLTLMQLLMIFLCIGAMVTQMYLGFILIDKPGALKMADPNKYNFWGGMLAWNVLLFLGLVLWIAWEENSPQGERSVWSRGFYAQSGYPGGRRGVRDPEDPSPYHAGYGPVNNNASRPAHTWPSLGGRTLGTGGSGVVGSASSSSNSSGPAPQLSEQEQQKRAEEAKARAAAEAQEARLRRNYGALGVPESREESAPLVPNNGRRDPEMDRPAMRDDHL